VTTNYRERAAELLKQVSEEINEELHDFSRDGDDEPFTTADLDKIWIDAIASLLQQVAEESAPKWIPVSTPPKFAKWYLVAETSGSVSHSYWNGEKWSGGCEWIPQWWMHKPAAPKGE
jgi:hypothetical protein